MGIIRRALSHLADFHDTVTAPVRVDHGLIGRDKRRRAAERAEDKNADEYRKELKKLGKELGL